MVSNNRVIVFFVIRKIIRKSLQLFYDLLSFRCKQRGVLLIFSKQSLKYENLKLLQRALLDEGIDVKITMDGLCLKNIYHLASSKVICIDQATRLTSTIRLNGKNSLLQVWHAGGAYKKIGYDAWDGTKKDLARIRRIHGSTSWFVVSDSKLISLYSRAFALEPSRILPFGLLRSDGYFHRTKQNANYILWAPTFRTNSGKRVIDELSHEIMSLKIEFGKMGYGFAVRLHPSIRIDLEKLGVEDWSNYPLTCSLGKTRILITDYSSIIFDYSMYEGAIFWYVRDIDSYMKNERGLYFNPLIKYPEFSAITIESLLEKITIKSRDNCSDVRDEYMSACNGNSCLNTAKFIKQLIED